MSKGNYAFIDAQNLNYGLTRLRWKIDWKKFREYLKTEKNIEVAYVFIGFMLGNQDLYLVLQKAGFVVVFKEVFANQSGDVKGNIDAELILQAMIDYDRYDRALIVSGDGDFTCLLKYLDQNDKLEGVLAPYEKSLSSLIVRAADGKIEHLRSLRRRIEYRPVRENRVKTARPPRLLDHPDVNEKVEAGAGSKDLPKQTSGASNSQKNQKITPSSDRQRQPKKSSRTTMEGEDELYSGFWEM